MSIFTGGVLDYLIIETEVINDYENNYLIYIYLKNNYKKTMSIQTIKGLYKVYYDKATRPISASYTDGPMELSSNEKKLLDKSISIYGKPTVTEIENTFSNVQLRIID